MGDLRSIDGGKGKRAEALASAAILECRGCGSRTMKEVRTGVLVGKGGKVVHKGTPTLECARCGKHVYP